MCQFIETIRLEEGILQNIERHNLRMNTTRKQVLSRSDNLDLRAFININEVQDKSIHKCRIIYSKNIEQIEITPYAIKPVNTLKVVFDNDIDYSYKYADRSSLQKLFNQRETCDDVIIVKNGFITDSFYCNLVFFDGNNWVTPSTPLLKGVERDRLLYSHQITEKAIKLKELFRFKTFKQINSMIPFEIAAEIPIKNIAL